MNRLTLALTAVALLGTAGVAVTQQQHGTGHGSHATASPSGKALMDVHQKMMQDMQMQPSGDADRDFAAMMIPHHQGAIDMARSLLQHGRDPLVRQLAEEIIANRQVEIQSMQNRLAILRADRARDAAADQALGGTRGDLPAAAPPREQHPMPHH